METDKMSAKSGTIEKPKCPESLSDDAINININGAFEPVLRRDIKPLEIIALGFNVCNSWIAFSTSLAIAISAGGTVTVLYGILIVTLAYFAVSITLSELASVYPTAGGQYHFTSILCPDKSNRLVSYICGLAAVCSWTFLAASITILSSQLLLAVPAFYIETFVPQGWHYFLVFQAINLVLLLYNIFCLQRASWTHSIGFALSLVMFLIIFVTCLALSSKASSESVWTTFDNQTGWPAGVTFLTGLVTPASMYGGIDAVLHLAEECTSPERTVPRAMMAIVTIGCLTGFGFAVAMCYSITNLEALMTTTMPIYELWRQATGNNTAATVFDVMLHIITLFAVTAVQQTASRMTWAFARDGGLPGSSYLAVVNSKHQVPVWALVANSVVIFICGCIYLGSGAAFSAVIGSSLVLQIISFTIPALLLLWHKRSDSVLPRDGAFRVPDTVGWAANVLVVIFGIVFSVFFILPAAIPVTGNSMNYASAVIAICAICGSLNWVFYSKKRFVGPRIEQYRRT
ncbi:hypothetical protein SNK03_007566 [Fusarium graminearum]|uniref:Choline transport protein n=2 Tax=Gibberella zeae (strain ATCC MYA-4620 / CBS 123657 / FGSC 9075 / NRRL 31084 / PH-1) TaxID=229533 RepID=I1RL86_GIBZE|nr:hypothetical protein FGSG_04672 [Fusarium graminearum PH-1]ESU08395.1 hypothetical protein FGSG_04672 [Fusarium graminearum PH-1]CAF3479992.1 unnamed protein product [Fusarium graminearum]|eukprot:XP_011320894.1 hypothetical protein FGSG_04672 [Fusarium graminearum PH-1]